MTKTVFSIDVKTVSESNCSEHWIKRGKRHTFQKFMVKKIFIDNKFNFKLPIEITLIRVAPRSLDRHDNLPSSMKWIVDQISAQITGDNRPGRADDCGDIIWKYDQRKGKPKQYYVEVIIEEK